MTVVALLGVQPQDDCAPRSTPADPKATTSAPTTSAAPSSAAPSSAAPSANPAPIEPTSAFTVATFNAGLARGWVKYADARRPAIHEALARAEVDLLCVQEYWATEDYVALLKATSKRLPVQHRATARRSQGACTPQTLASIERCAMDACSDRDQALVSCVTERCKESARGASRACMQCLAGRAVAGKELAGCAEDLAVPTREILPAGGVALLSAQPIAARDVLTLASPLLDRLVLYARLDDTPLGTVDVFCTHLTTPLPVDLPGMAPAINRHQVESLLAFVESKMPPGVTLVLGDLNNGPAIGQAIRGHYPSHYALLPEAGFVNPHASSHGVACTRCDANPLVGGRGDGGVLIDHVLVKGHTGSARATRWLDEPTVPVGAVQVPPSDHYGVRTTLLRDTR